MGGTEAPPQSISIESENTGREEGGGHGCKISKGKVV